MFSFYITLLIVGFISGVSMERCPEAEDIYPCNCRKDIGTEIILVICSSDSLEVLRQALGSLSGKNNVRLILTGLNIRLPSNFFAGIGIPFLEFHSCRIDILTNNDQPVLLGLENHLEDLTFIDSFAVPRKLNIGHLRKLKHVFLINNKITELGDDWLFAGPYSLESLFISGNNITKVGSNAFSQLHNLVSLRLDDNRFGVIKRSMFPTTADRLERLFLENNGLMDLPIDLFSRMPSIDHVSLAKNKISTLDERTWSPVWHQLEDVWLQDNNIICDDRLIWITKSNRKPFVAGECSAPKEFKGEDVEYFLKSLRQ